MTQAHSSPLASVLAAPWQQRRNVGSLWGCCSSWASWR